MTIHKFPIFFLLCLWLFCSAASTEAQFHLPEVNPSEKDKGLIGKMDLSFALTRGNSDSLLLDSAVLIGYQTKKYYCAIAGNLLYEEKDRQSYISKGAVQVRGIRWLRKRLMVEVFGRKEFDRFILLKDRTQAGGGFRYRVLDTGTDEDTEDKERKFTVDIGIGLLWEAEKFDPDEAGSERESTSRLKSKNYLSLTWQINKKLLFEAGGNFLFDLGEPDNFRVETEAAFSFKISQSLSYQTRLQYRYDNAPPETVKPYDFYLKNGLSLQF